MRLTFLGDVRVSSFVCLVLIGCGSGAGTSSGTGGTTGTAGTTGSAGTTGDAGTTGAAGTTGTAGRGGTTGTAGTAGTTGAAGRGGTTGTAGTTGAAGTMGSAGTTGSAGRGGSGGGGTTGTAGGGGSAGAGGTTTLAGCTPGQMTVSGTLAGRYGTLAFTAGQSYFMQVNEWNSSATQTVAYGGSFFFKMTTQMASTATNGGPTGFPSIFIGANSRHTTSGSNLPKAVSALTTVPTTWNWNDAGTLADDTANSYNATYDVWFSTQAAGEPTASGPSGGYLMVWLHKPADAQPIGTPASVIKAVTIPGVSGTWDIWIGLNGSRPCISYVRTETTTSLSFDLNAFIKDAVANRSGTILSTWYLTNIFTGFEIWRGGVNLESTSFCAIVN